MYNKKQVGKIYYGSGGQVEQTSDFYNLIQTGTGILSATGNPIGALLGGAISFLDNIFCGAKCHARRAARAKSSGAKVSGMCNCNNCCQYRGGNYGMGQIKQQKPKVF